MPMMKVNRLNLISALEKAKEKHKSWIYEEQLKKDKKKQEILPNLILTLEKELKNAIKCLKLKVPIKDSQISFYNYNELFYRDKKSEIIDSIDIMIAQLSLSNDELIHINENSDFLRYIK